MSDIVLITGATGHIGFAVLTEALKKGHKVRSAIRRESAIAELTSEPAIQPYLSQLTFTIVPDITIPGAFDGALEGVTHVIHLASPLSNRGDGDFDKDIVQPAVLGTTSILESALKVPSVRKIVITASIASVRPPTAAPGYMIHPDTVLPDPQGPFQDPFSAYAASKTKAHLSVLKFAAEKKPHFSIVNVMPSFVIGPNVLAKTPEKINSGSNAVVLSILLGIETAPRPALLVHVDDVAFVHVAALDDKITGVQNFGLAYDAYEGDVDVNQVAEIAREKYPKEVQEGIFPLGVRAEAIKSRFDIRRTEEVFEFRQKGLENMVTDLADYYVKRWRQANGEAKA